MVRRRGMAFPGNLPAVNADLQENGKTFVICTVLRSSYGCLPPPGADEGRMRTFSERHETMRRTVKRDAGAWSVPVAGLLLLLALPLTAAAQEEEPLDWHAMSEAQQLARENGRKIFVFAEAEWCTYCKRMRSEIFPREDVQSLMEEHYYPVSVDIESDERLTFNGSTMSERAFSRNMRVSATPTLIILDESGEVMGVQPGFLPADVFVPLLEYVVSDSYGKMAFKEYLENRSGE